MDGKQTREERGACIEGGKWWELKRRQELCLLFTFTYQVERIYRRPVELDCSDSIARVVWGVDHRRHEPRTWRSQSLECGFHKHFGGQTLPCVFGRLLCKIQSYFLSRSSSCYQNKIHYPKQSIEYDYKTLCVMGCNFAVKYWSKVFTWVNIYMIA